MDDTTWHRVYNIVQGLKIIYNNYYQTKYLNSIYTSYHLHACINIVVRQPKLLKQSVMRGEKRNIPTPEPQREIPVANARHRSK